MANLKTGSRPETKYLRRTKAAHYVDCSPSTFDILVEKGILPPPLQLSERIKLWITDQLDEVIENLPIAKASVTADKSDGKKALAEVKLDKAEAS